jgi:hypothetical protein
VVFFQAMNAAGKSGGGAVLDAVVARGETAAVSDSPFPLSGSPRTRRTGTRFFFSLNYVRRFHLAVGVPLDGSGSGAFWVFTFNSTLHMYVQAGKKSAPSPGSSYQNFAKTMAMNAMALPLFSEVRRCWPAATCGTGPSCLPAGSGTGCDDGTHPPP